MKQIIQTSLCLWLRSKHTIFIYRGDNHANDLKELQVHFELKLLTCAVHMFQELCKTFFLRRTKAFLFRHPKTYKNMLRQDWPVCSEDNKNSEGQKSPLNANMRKITAGFGQQGDQWVLMLVAEISG